MRRAFTLIELLVVIAIIAVLIGFLANGGGDWFFQVIGHVVLGWVWYVARVVPRLDPDAGEVTAGVVSLVLAVIGVHLFGRWLYREWHARAAGPPPARWRWRWTARVVALVVLLFAAGTAAVGITHQTGWLLSGREPRTERRSPLARAISSNNLKQIGIALDSHQNTKQTLPASTFTPDGRPLHSWQTQLLPFIEEDALYKRIKFDRPWNHPDNADAMTAKIRVFLNPRVAEQDVHGYGATHYAANVLTLGGDRPRRTADFPQGAANTVLAAEATTNRRAWGDPLNWRDPRLGINRHPDGFAGPTADGVMVLLADGSVRFVSKNAAAGLLTGKFED